jgi:DNA-binding transcriptional MerR regulator
MRQPLRKIGDAAAELEITTRALRFYEEEGLIVPARTAKGTRLYSDEYMTRLRVILLLAAAGVSIQAIKELGTARSKSRNGDAASRAVSRLLGKLRETATAKKNQYALLERELHATDKLVQQCLGCEVKPTRSACFSCTTVPHFRKAFMIKLIAEQNDPGSRAKGK